MVGSLYLIIIGKHIDFQNHSVNTFWKDPSKLSEFNWNLKSLNFILLVLVCHLESKIRRTVYTKKVGTKYFRI